MRPCGFAHIATAIIAVVLLAGGAGAQPREEARVLTADEIAERLAQRGYRDVRRPQRRGQIYLVEVTDREGSRRVLVVTVTEALIVGDGPAPSPGARLPRSVIPTAEAPR